MQPGFRPALAAHVSKHHSGTGEHDIRNELLEGGIFLGGGPVAHREIFQNHRQVSPHLLVEAMEAAQIVEDSSGKTENALTHRLTQRFYFNAARPACAQSTSCCSVPLL